MLPRDGARTLRSFYPQAFKDEGGIFGVAVKVIGVFLPQMNRRDLCDGLKAIGRLGGFQGSYAGEDVSDALGAGRFLLVIR